MTMTDNATDAPEATAVRSRQPKLDQQIHVLVTDATRAYTLGLASIAADAQGFSGLREGVEVRDLLDEAIAARFADDAGAYRTAVLRGRQILAERASSSAA